MRRSLWFTGLLLSIFFPLMAQDHTVLATSATVEWGHYAAKAKPAITVKSGDTVKMQTLSTCGPNDRLIARGIKPEDIPAYNDEVYKNYPKEDKGPGGHILTGPVAIEDAEPGMCLRCRF
jgi:acetamidase/formamidase